MLEFCVAHENCFPIRRVEAADLVYVDVSADFFSY